MSAAAAEPPEQASGAKRATAKKPATAKKTTSAATKKSTASKSTASKSTASKSTAKKASAAKKATANKTSTAKKASTGNKTTGKKTTPEKRSPRKSAAATTRAQQSTVARSGTADPVLGISTSADPRPADIASAAINAAVEAERLRAAQAGHPEAAELDVAEWLARAARLSLGAAVLAAATGGRVVVDPQARFHAPGEQLPAQDLIDIATGAADLAVSAVARVLGPVLRRAEPPVAATSEAGRGALARWARAAGDRARPLLEPLRARGAMRREQAEQEVAAAAEAALPQVMDLVLDRVDLTAYAMSRLDMRAVLDAAFDQIDMAEIVVDRVDLERVVRASLAKVDLTEIALENLNMQRVVEDTVRNLDMVALVRSQLEGVDLAELLRTSPTTLAGEALRTTSRLVRGR